MDIIEKLNTRASVKVFDKDKKVSDKDLDTILESIRLAPSSYGLQGWKFVVITNPKIKQQIREIAKDQSQITDCSHLIVLCYIKDMWEDHIDKYIKEISEKRHVPFQELEMFRNRAISKASKEHDGNVWLQKQVYIALGFLVYTCAMLDIDCCPIEWFDNDKCDEILWLDKLSLWSITLCPIGYRSEDDVYSKMAKLRFPKEDVFIYIK